MTPTSTPTRRNAATIRRLVLTLALGLISLVITALALAGGYVRWSGLAPC